METTALYSIRAKKLGMMLRSARSVFGKSTEECAVAMGVPLETYSQFELGQQSPSLPQLELFAYFVGISLDIFWEDKMPSKEEHKVEQSSIPARLNLRSRVIGVLLRKRRMEQGLSLDDLADRAGLSPEQLTAYESGRMAVPVPVLEELSEILSWTMVNFEDNHGPVGEFFVKERSARNFKTLPPSLQRFVVQPVNRPYLDLALRLSEMDVKKLRSVAEGLLEITL